MKSEYLLAIERLRQSRDRTAAVALGTALVAATDAVNTVATFERQLTLNTTSQLQLEASLYEDALTGPMTGQELKEMSQRIQTGKYRIDRMGTQLVQLKDEASNAVARGEAARLKRAAAVRSLRKWERLKEILSAQASVDEMHREESIHWDE